MSDPSEPVNLVTTGPPVTAEVPPATENVADSDTRHFIAWFLLCVFAGTILAAFSTIWAGVASVSDVKDILGILIPPIVGLLGSVMGFYYGAKAAQRGN